MWEGLAKEGLVPPKEEAIIPLGVEQCTKFWAQLLELGSVGQDEAGAPSAAWCHVLMTNHSRCKNIKYPLVDRLVLNRFDKNTCFPECVFIQDLIL